MCLRATFWPPAPRLGPRGSGLRPWVPRFPPTVTAVLVRQRSMRQCPNAGVNHRPVRTSRAPRKLRESLPGEGRTRTLGFGVYLSGVPPAWGPSAPAKERRWARSRNPQHSSPRRGVLAGYSDLPPPRTRVRASRLGPSPMRGEGEGADGSNYGSDPPPPVARGRKTGCVRFPGWEGRRPRPASGQRRGGGAGPGGDFLPPGTGLGDSRRKGEAPPSRSGPQSVFRPVSQQAQRLPVSELRGFSGWAGGPGWGERSCPVVQVAT